MVRGLLYSIPKSTLTALQPLQGPLLEDYWIGKFDGTSSSEQNVSAMRSYHRASVRHDDITEPVYLQSAEFAGGHGIHDTVKNGVFGGVESSDSRGGGSGGKSITGR